jgi:CBS domain containing-hemolysin-like protein
VEKVADATRPAVYYLPQDALITEVISASLKTGRQLFLVRNEADEIVGLITLADVLAKVLGRPLTAKTQE